MIEYIINQCLYERSMKNGNDKKLFWILVCSSTVWFMIVILFVIDIMNCDENNQIWKWMKTVNHVNDLADSKK